MSFVTFLIFYLYFHLIQNVYGNKTCYNFGCIIGTKQVSSLSESKVLPLQYAV
jgi:hypothetical protein